MDTFVDSQASLLRENLIITEIGKSQLNSVIHSPIRLRIMSVLMVAGKSTPIEFPVLRELLEATDGNLGAHLTRLEKAHYIETNRTSVFRGRPLTYISITEIGRQAYKKHAATLMKILNFHEI